MKRASSSLWTQHQANSCSQRWLPWLPWQLPCPQAPSRLLQTQVPSSRQYLLAPVVQVASIASSSHSIRLLQTQSSSAPRHQAAPVAPTSQHTPVNLSSYPPQCQPVAPRSSYGTSLLVDSRTPDSQPTMAPASSQLQNWLTHAALASPMTPGSQWAPVTPGFQDIPVLASSTAPGSSYDSRLSTTPHKPSL